MRCAMIVLLLCAASTRGALLSDGAGLALELSERGNITAVKLNGKSTPSGGIGGFYLSEPNGDKKVSVPGKVVAESGKFHLEATSSLNARLTATLVPGNGYVEVAGELEDLTGTDRGLWLGFNVPIDTTGMKWGQTLSTSPVVSAANPGYAQTNNLVPIPAVWNNAGGIALCIPPMNPCVFEVGADAEGLRMQMAFGLSPHTAKFPSKAKFRLRIYAIDGTWGLRDALAKYYDWYPDYYTIEPGVMKALDHHHDWIGANFVGKEPPDKTEHLINQNKKTFMAYTKTSARIQGVENVANIKTPEQVVDAINASFSIHHYVKNADPDSPLLKQGHSALVNSIAFDPHGHYATILKPKSREIDFPHNCDPDLFADRNVPVFGSMYLHKVAGIHEWGNYSSVHWDRVGGWGNSLNYRREHFAYIDHPLTFDQAGRVCIHTKFTHYELFDALATQGQKLGLFHEAAGMKVYGWNKQPNQPAGHQKDGRFFTAALVAGGWHEGSFKPIDLGGFDFERMVVGRKAYRISSGNIVAHQELPTLEAVKRALAQTTAYGFACPVQIQYFYTPGHPRYRADYSWICKPEHRALWERYEPANLAIRLAGWEPVTGAWSSSNAVQVQRFGRGRTIYLTVWGPEPPQDVSIDVDAVSLGLNERPSFTEIVNNVHMQVSKSARGWTLTVPMEQNMTRVIRIR